MTLTEIMDGLATLSGETNAYPWPVESITVPCSVVGYPETWDFDVTFQRGADRATFPVWIIVGKSTSLQSRDALSDRLTGVGSLKENMDGQQTFGTVRVTNAEPSEISVAGVTYIGIKLTTEVVG